MKNENRTLLSAAVDRLATIKAQVAALTAEEKELKTILAESGELVIEGSLHRAAISNCAGRDSIDWAAIAAKFEPSRQLITAHTTTGAPFAVVRLSARKGA
jgi:hypothetical protein